MSHDRNDTKQASGTRSEGRADDRRMGFDCCGTRMGDVMAECPCGFFMKRHPFVMSTLLAVMALTALAIPAGIILGIIAFFRTF